MGSYFNIATRTREERDKVTADLAAAAVARKERMNQPVLPGQKEQAQPEHLRAYFAERLAYYRKVSTGFPGGNDPVYAWSEPEKPS